MIFIIVYWSVSNKPNLRPSYKFCVLINYLLSETHVSDTNYKIMETIEQAIAIKWLDNWQQTKNLKRILVL